MIRVDSGLNRIRSSAVQSQAPIESALETLRDWFADRPWVADALCTQTDPEIFFPELGESAEAAKKVCLACPVRRACKEDTLGRREEHGVWGGLSVKQRDAVRSERAGRQEVAA